MRHTSLYTLSIFLFLCISNASCQTTADKQKTIKAFPLNQNKISIIGIEKDSSASSGKSEYNSTCQGWSLDKKAVVEIIKAVRPISMHDFMYLYNVLPCEIEGKLKIGDKEYSYVINAGSFMKLSSKDTTYYYGCSAKECEKYFLSTGGDPNKDLGE